MTTYFFAARLQPNQVPLQKIVVEQQPQVSEFSSEKDLVQSQDTVKTNRLLQKSEVVAVLSANGPARVSPTLATSPRPVNSRKAQIPKVFEPQPAEEEKKPPEPLTIPPMKLSKLVNTPPSSTCSSFARTSKMLLYVVCDAEDEALTDETELSHGFTVYEAVLGSSSARFKRETTCSIPTSGEVGNKLLRIPTKSAVKMLKPFTAGDRLFVIAIMEIGYSYMYEIEINKAQTAGKSRIVQRIPHKFLTDVTVVHIRYSGDEKIYLAFSASAKSCKPHQTQCPGGAPVYRFIQGSLSLCDYVGMPRAFTVRGWEEYGVVVLAYVSHPDDDTDNSFLSFFEVDDRAECEVVPLKSQPHIDEVKGKSLCGIRAIEPFWRNRKTYLAVGISTAEHPFSCPSGSIEKSFVLLPHEKEADMFSTEKLTYFPGPAKVSGFNLIETPCTDLIETYGPLSSTEFHKAEVRDGQLVITTVPHMRDAPDNIQESAVANEKDRTYISFSRSDTHDLPLLELSCGYEKPKTTAKDRQRGGGNLPATRSRNFTLSRNRDVFESVYDKKEVDSVRQKLRVGNVELHHHVANSYKIQKQKFNASLAESAKKREKITKSDVKRSRPVVTPKEFNQPPPPPSLVSRRDESSMTMTTISSSRSIRNISLQRPQPPAGSVDFPSVQDRPANLMNTPVGQQRHAFPPIRDFVPLPPAPTAEDFFTPVQDIPASNRSRSDHTNPSPGEPQRFLPFRYPLPPVQDRQQPLTTNLTMLVPDVHERPPPIVESPPSVPNPPFLPVIDHMNRPPLHDPRHLSPGESRFGNQTFDRSGQPSPPAPEFQPPQTEEFEPVQDLPHPEGPLSFSNQTFNQPSAPSVLPAPANQVFLTNSTSRQSQPSPIFPSPVFHNPLPATMQQRFPPQSWPPVQQAFEGARFFLPESPLGRSSQANGKPVGSNKRRLKADRA
ncbi:hypothetical protein RvY_17173 [Ramazzottius varieornatus]|uniref:Uncharacterized protein n=1 Tax=Ramazzottius varieornatus TaxID=947166 RepID=A0A1D1W188_RAMVA|nr:hypothetical protein RvY_17173 [Ramazzottius varieornatus]